MTMISYENYHPQKQEIDAFCPEHNARKRDSKTERNDEKGSQIN